MAGIHVLHVDGAPCADGGTEVGRFVGNAGLKRKIAVGSVAIRYQQHSAIKIGALS